MTLVSRLLGFWREMILAQVFGASGVFDAFVIAFRIPNFLRTLFAEGAFSQAFVPVLSSYRAQKTHAETQHFINSVAGNMGLILLLIVGLVEIFSPWVVLGFAPGFSRDPGRLHLTQQLLHVTFPYIFLISLSALCGAVLNTYGRFAIAAFTPALLNIVMIWAAWYLAPRMHQPIMALAWGVMIAGVVQVFIQLPSLKRIKFLPLPIPCWKDPGVKRVMKLMVPALLGGSVAQVSLLIDNFFASFLPAGSVSWLYYSDRLIYLPVGVIGVALGTVVLPHLSRHFAQKSERAFSETIDWGLRCVLIAGMPAAIGLLALSGPLVATLFRHGEFDNMDVLMTLRSLMAFSIGLPAMMAAKILSSALYARHDTKTPALIAVYVLVASIGLNFVFIGPLAHAGLALVTSITSILDSAWLLYLLVQRDFYKPRAHWRAFLMRIAFASFVMLSVLWYFSGSTRHWLGRTTWVNAEHLMVLLVTGIIVYFACLGLSGMRLKHCSPPVEK